MKNYYGLVASMPDVSPDDAKLNFTVADFKEDYPREVSHPLLLGNVLLSSIVFYHDVQNKISSVTFQSKN